MNNLRSETPSVESSGTAQERQGRCNVTYRAIADQVYSAFVNNLCPVHARGKTVLFACRELFSKKGVIPFAFDLPDGGVSEIAISGYRSLMEVTAVVEGRRIPKKQAKALVLMHASLHERFLKENGSVYEIALAIYEAHLRTKGWNTYYPTNIAFGDMHSVLGGMAYFVQLILFNQGDQKDQRLAESWRGRRNLMGTRLSHLFFDCWFGRVEKLQVQSVSQSLAYWLTQR